MCACVAYRKNLLGTEQVVGTVGPKSLNQAPDIVVKFCLEPTQRLQCSSFLVMTHSLLRDSNILPKKELHVSLWVYQLIWESLALRTDRWWKLGALCGKHLPAT